LRSRGGDGSLLVRIVLQLAQTPQVDRNQGGMQRQHRPEMDSRAICDECRIRGQRTKSQGSALATDKGSQRKTRSDPADDFCHGVAPCGRSEAAYAATAIMSCSDIAATTWRIDALCSQGARRVPNRSAGA